jgi:hypothetical protein
MPDAVGINVDPLLGEVWRTVVHGLLITTRHIGRGRYSCILGLDTVFGITKNRPAAARLHWRAIRHLLAKQRRETCWGAAGLPKWPFACVPVGQFGLLEKEALERLNQTEEQWLAWLEEE